MTNVPGPRRLVAAAAFLDGTGMRRPAGEPISLRRVIADMVAEYARRNGPADPRGEGLDGAAGG
ncbi:DUF664 domain-containing protein [Streptomyces caatingaensis]|uniref:Uncharacterized protein n=1 Tax=Streptomyces caatingaensis TaxID=1678637 RepID=A0A0K9XKV9_9ACTN|nr:DUF664 domain-containing protein [Streptomyces caatingaensis]KNB53985.1 hypothetical protein AC230_05355 [Streptomyces caatingaensis]